MSTANNQPFDVAILGGGPAGYVAALVAAQRGARVALIEKDRVGGTCLNVGCIPTKALATATELLVRARRAGEFGLAIPHAEADMPGLRRYQKSTVDALVGGVEQLLRARRVMLLRGTARLVKPDTLSVEEREGRREITARRVILAPGSVPAQPPIEGRDVPGVMDSTGALHIESVPARLVVVGGGVIGLEFACIYEALGSRVTVLEMMSALLPGATDEPLARRLALQLRRRGLDIRTGAAVRRIERVAEALRVVSEISGVETTVECDRVLLATGRWPNTDGIGVDELGLHRNARFLAVDERLATNLPNVWAAGDAIGGAMLAHKAMVDGRVAAENATGGRRRADYRSVPNVIFTRPEVAGVGLTEAEARTQGAEIKISQFPFAANPKARILGEADGLVRLIAEAGSGRILGVHLLGPHATDLIAEGALAVQLGATADDLAWTTHAHPTLPEAMLEAALGVDGHAIHFHTA